MKTDQCVSSFGWQKGQLEEELEVCLGKWNNTAQMFDILTEVGSTICQKIKPITETVAGKNEK